MIRSIAFNNIFILVLKLKYLQPTIFAKENTENYRKKHYFNLTRKVRNCFASRFHMHDS